MNDINKTLAARGHRYGEFEDCAIIAQMLKSAMRDTSVYRWKQLSPDMREALEMIQHKIARIINGDENFIEGWHDIAGYATLVENRLQDTEGATNAKVSFTERKKGRWVNKKSG